jgi:hypothetical protein
MWKNFLPEQLSPPLPWKPSCFLTRTDHNGDLNAPIVMLGIYPAEVDGITWNDTQTGTGYHLPTKFEKRSFEPGSYSGQALRQYYIEKLGLTVGQVCMFDLWPYYLASTRINAKTGHTVWTNIERYHASQGGLSPIIKRPPPQDLLRKISAAPGNKERLLEYFNFKRRRLIITLGNEAAAFVRGIEDCDEAQKHLYGRAATTLSILGHNIPVIHLAHPGSMRANKKQGIEETYWGKRHLGWCASTGKSLIAQILQNTTDTETIVPTKEIGKMLSDSYREANPGGRRRQIKFPSKILVKEFTGNILELDLGENAHANMQTDAAAFEAWALALHYWISKYHNWKIRLSWNIPVDCSSGHYQRFLYRAKRFAEIFPDWFHVMNEAAFNSSKLSFVSGTPSQDIYRINYPLAPANPEATNAEARLERCFVVSEEFREVTCLDNQRMDQQLPVGVFTDIIGRNSAIFTHGHSDIDLWGFRRDASVLNLFELKKRGNEKLGIISELFFYTVLMEDLREGRISYPEDVEPVGRRIPHPFSQESSIKSWFLAPRLHPLITPQLIESLNSRLENRRIRFGYISFDYNTQDYIPGNITKRW